MSKYSAAVMALTPAAYWRCGEASGNLADSSGNGLTMVLQGSATYAVGGAIAGDPNTAISLSGADANYFLHAGAAALDVDDVFTIVAWIKKAENGRRMAIVDYGEVGGNGPILEFSAANQLQAGKQGVGFFAISTPTITDTNWHMVAVTKSGTTRHLYIDAVDVAFTGTDLTVVSTATDDVAIGKNPVGGGNNWNGSLDEIMIKGAALTAAQIATLWAVGRGAIDDRRRRR